MKQANFAFVLLWSVMLLASTHAQPPTSGVAPQTKPPGTAKPTGTSTKVLPKENAAKEAEPELTPQQQRALSLVREAGQEAASLADKRSAAQILAKAADLLWPHDASTAKELFTKAFDTGLAHYRDTNDDNRRQLSKNSYTSRPDVLLEVIRLVNPHNKELGRSYTDRYIEEKKRQREAKGDQSSEKDLNRLLGDNQTAATGLWRVADSLLETDAKLSVEIATRAVTLAVTPDAARYVQKLSARDRGMANQLFMQALNRLRADPAPLPSQLLLLTAYPFGMATVQMTDGNSIYGYGVATSRDFAPDLTLIRQFLTTAYSVLVRVAEPATLQLSDAVGRFNAAFYALKLLEPKVAEFQAQLVDEWHALAARLTTQVAEKARQRLETNAQRDTVPRSKPQSLSDPQEEIENTLQQAERAADINQRDMLYAKAAIATIQVNDPERGLNLAGKIVDLTLRRDVKSWVGYNASERARNDKHWDDARRYAIEVAASEVRAYLLFQLAGELSKSGDPARAASLLEEAYHFAVAAENSPGKVKALLGIANAYASTDFVRGYEVAEAAVKTANQLPRDKSNLEPDDTNLVSVISYGGGSFSRVSTVEGFDLGRTAANLAKHDLERSLSLLRSLDHLALRYSATVTVAESLLKPIAK